MARVTVAVVGSEWVFSDTSTQLGGVQGHFDTACDLNIIRPTVKGEVLLKVTGSHVHWKSGNISETVLRELLQQPLTGSDRPSRILPI